MTFVPSGIGLESLGLTARPGLLDQKFVSVGYIQAKKKVQVHHELRSPDT